MVISLLRLWLLHAWQTPVPSGPPQPQSLTMLEREPSGAPVPGITVTTLRVIAADLLMQLTASFY